MVLGQVNGFYLMRIVLAVICAACQTRLFRAIGRSLNDAVATLFVLAMAFSPGTFHASVAYLPSSFAMYGSMLGLAAFMDWRGGLKTAQGIMWFGIAGIVGWPFAVAMALPLVLEEMLLAVVGRGMLNSTLWRALDGLVRCSIVLVRLNHRPLPSVLGSRWG